MASTKTRLLCQLQSVLAGGKGSRLLDGKLLEQFTTESDQAAFATLVRRHGPMVLSVCRRVLHNADDAEDAFQATFLVLARKASAIGKREALPAWLHKVALRIALRARSGASQRQKHEQRATGRLAEDPLAAITGRELLTVLDQELQALPAPCRAPLILCYLEEHTRDEAARQLGLTLATLKRRLERGKALLRRRLERCGLAMAAAFLALDSIQTTAKATLPSTLAATATRVAMQAAAGKSVAEVASAQIAVLVSGMLRAMTLGKILVGSALFITVALVGMGIGFAAYLGQDGHNDEQQQIRSPAVSAPREPQQAPEKQPEPAEDLPAGARARLGTARFLNLGQVLAVAYSPDGRLLAGGAWDGSIRIWESGTGHERLYLQDSENPVGKLAFSPDGKLLAAVGRFLGLRLWDIRTGRLIKRVQPLDKELIDVAFSPDGQKIAGVSMAGTGGSIHVWDATGKELWSEGGSFYHRCAFDGPNTLVYISRGPAPGYRWYLKRRSFLPDNEKTLQELAGVAFLGPDLKFAAVLMPEQVYYFALDGVSPGPPIRINGLYTFLCFSPDRRMLGISQTIQQGCRLSVWEICTGRERYHFDCPDRANPALAFSRDGRTLVSGSVDVTLLLWDLAGQRRPRNRLSASDLEKLWIDLMSSDAEVAYRALWNLASAPGQATVFLTEKLPPAAPPREDVAALIRDLADKRFSVRQRATTELIKLDHHAQPALQQALRAGLDLETRRRIEQLLGRLDQLSPEMVRAVRAVEALERMQTPEAHELLRKLARGTPAARLTQDAAEACKRLEVRN